MDRFGDKYYLAHGESDLSSYMIRSNHNGVLMQLKPTMYDNGPLAIVSNSVGFVITTAYGNLARKRKKLERQRQSMNHLSQQVIMMSLRSL